MKASKAGQHRGVLRRLFRLVMKAGIVAGVVAAARAVIGRTSGEPGVAPQHEGSASRGTPMSFDTWPAVPEAPSRRNG